MALPIKHHSVHKYLKSTISLIGTFCFISLLEFAASKPTEMNLLIRFANDLWCGIAIAVVWFPLFLVMAHFAKKQAITISMVFFALCIITQYALVRYSLTTLVNLGADLLGYSFDDIVNTVLASESFSLAYFIPFVMFPTMFILLTKVLINNTSHRAIAIGIMVSIPFFVASSVLVKDMANSRNQNKMAFLITDIINFKRERSRLNKTQKRLKGYPLLKSSNMTKDVLSPFFALHKKKPNVVILIVEGLGAEFTNNHIYSGFTPFLDSLKLESLYWDNFVSNTGRTFGVLPSLLGSLPFGDTGFLELQKTPSHLSLINILKTNGYTTSFYSGDQSSFDKKINFLEYNEIDNIIDENKYGPEYTKTEHDNNGFSWGYPDAEIFKKTLVSMDVTSQPRLDIIMTLSNHEPFDFPQKEAFVSKVDSILNSGKTFQVPKKVIQGNKAIFASLYYTDCSIRNFMNAYARRSDFDNTIFIITGDHRLIPIGQKDQLCRFHVPLYIYSPMLTACKSFKSISSHWDVTPSLVSLLDHRYALIGMKKTAWMGSGLDTVQRFRNIHQIAMMRYKGRISDFIYKDYLYSEGTLYRITENFETFKVNKKNFLHTISDSLLAFKDLNAYVTDQDRILPDSLNSPARPRIAFSESQLQLIDSLTHGLTYDQMFQVAKENAFDGQRMEARLLCDYILNAFPNHADARTLKGRTLAWEGDYKKAEMELMQVLERTPYYDDSYLALLDLYWWSGHDEKSEEIYQEALENNITNPKIGVKMAKAYLRMKNQERTDKVMDSIIDLHPGIKNHLKENL